MYSLKDAKNVNNLGPNTETLSHTIVFYIDQSGTLWRDRFTEVYRVGQGRTLYRVIPSPYSDVYGTRSQAIPEGQEMTYSNTFTKISRDDIIMGYQVLVAKPTSTDYIINGAKNCAIDIQGDLKLQLNAHAADGGTCDNYVNAYRNRYSHLVDDVLNSCDTTGKYLMNKYGLNSAAIGASYAPTCHSNICRDHGYKTRPAKISGTTLSCAPLNICVNNLNIQDSSIIESDIKMECKVETDSPGGNPIKEPTPDPTTDYTGATETPTLHDEVPPDNKGDDSPDEGDEGEKEDPFDDILDRLAEQKTLIFIIVGLIIVVSVVSIMVRRRRRENAYRRYAELMDRRRPRNGDYY